MNSNRIYLYVLLSIFAAFIPAIVFRDFNALNELNYLSMAQEALDNGNWFAFYEHGVPYFDTPPLYLWICMIAMAIAGVHAMPLVLLASTIPFVLIIALLDRYLAYEFRHQERLLIMIGMCSMLVLDVIALLGRMDMLFSMVILLSYLKLMKRYILLKDLGANENNERPKYGNLSIPFLLFLGLFINGPYGILLPLLSILVLMTINKEHKRFFSVVRPHYFVLILLLVMLWALGVYIEGGSAYLNSLFYEQSAKTLGLIQGVSVVHQEPFYFFFKIFLIMTLPIGFGALYFVIRHLYLRETLDIKIQACLSFVLVTLVIISIPKSKLEIYLLPALPMVFYYVVLSYRTMQIKHNKPYFELEYGQECSNIQSDSSNKKLNDNEQYLSEDEQNEERELKIQLRAAQAERELKLETLAIQETDENNLHNHHKTEFSIAQNTQADDLNCKQEQCPKLANEQEQDSKVLIDSSKESNDLNKDLNKDTKVVDKELDKPTINKSNTSDLGVTNDSVNPLKIRLASILNMDHQGSSFDSQDNNDSLPSSDAYHLNDEQERKVKQDTNLDSDLHKDNKIASNLSIDISDSDKKSDTNTKANLPLDENTAKESNYMQVITDNKADTNTSINTAFDSKLSGSGASLKESEHEDSIKKTTEIKKAEPSVLDSNSQDYQNEALFKEESQDNNSVKYYRRSGHQGIEIVGHGYFLSGINTVGERTKLPKLFSLSMALPLVVYIALFAVYFVVYNQIPALQSSIIGVSFGILSFISAIALFFLLSRLFIFSLAALGLGTLIFVFTLGFAMPHLNTYLGMGVYAKVAIKAIDSGASNIICINRFDRGVDLNFYDKRIEVVEDPNLLQKCLDENATIILNHNGIKEKAHIVEQMKAKDAFMIGDKLVLPAKVPVNKLPYSIGNGFEDNLPLELKIN